MVSDQEISRCVESLLRQSAPGSVTSVNGVVVQLESKLGLDLSHKASFIRDQINLLLCPAPAKDHFALHPHPHPHPHPQPHHFHPSPSPSLSPSPSASASASAHNYHQQQHVPGTAGGFGYLPHELGFRYPPPPTASSVTAVHEQFQHQQHHHLQQQQHHHLQQQQQQFPAVTAPAAARPVVAPAPKESAPTGVKRRGGPGGLSKVCGVSLELQAIVGEPTMARTEIVKQLWAYIRKNNLQDPNNKRKIICNDELRLVFETDCTDMFKMNKLLAKHIIPLGPKKDSAPDSKRLKSTSAPEVVSATKADDKEYPVVISDTLAEFFGTGERQVLESEALRRVWDYIKANDLEDPVNAMVISCDSKFQQLFGSEKLSALEIPEMLARHLFKQS